jgi:transposase
MPKRDAITSPYQPDVAAVRAWLEKMIAAMRLVELVVAVVALITRMRDLNTELTKQLEGLRRKRPRSETIARLEGQLALAFEGGAAEAKPRSTKRRPPQSRVGRHPGRAAFPPHLERIPVDNPVPPELRRCPICGKEMKTVGHSICEILEVIPARVVVLQRRDETVACPHDDMIVSAPTPPQLVERGKLGTGLIVEAMADKYLEHLPIERQCRRWERAGVPIAPQTLGRSVACAIDLLSPISRVIEAQTRAPGLLATDMTGLPVLDPAVPANIRTGSVACWTNARWVTFLYSPSGDSDSVKRFLGNDLARTVQCDGTNVTTFLERAGGKRPGCWSHARRRLVEAARGGDALALQGLRIIRGLFEVERESALAGDTAEARQARRLECSAPILDKILEWVDEQRAVIPPRTPLGAGLGYLHRQWKRLKLFLDDGNIELTNNRLERELRKLVLGVKNWLFTWDDIGGERTASILTIVGTCVAHQVNPRAYLHLVTRLLVDGWPQKRLRELLPDRIVVEHPELSAPHRAQLGSALPHDVPLLPAPA